MPTSPDLNVVSLPIHVDDLDAAVALFDQIQVWRSTTELGTYSEITAATSLPAKLLGSVAGPWSSLSGKTLTVAADNADPVDIVFSGTDPLNILDAIAQVNAVVPGLASASPADANKLLLTSLLSGTQGSLTVTGSAAAVLGLSTTKVNGYAARILLTKPTTDYLFRDYDGSETLWYKTRFYSSITKAASIFAAPRQGTPQAVLPSGALALAVVNLSDGMGKPIVGRRILFVPIDIVTVQSGSDLYGSLPGVDRLVAETDSKGHAEISLVVGQKFKVFFEGTNYQREFVVPNTTPFNLLTVLSTASDPFSIVQAPPSPIRVS